MISGPSHGEVELSAGVVRNPRESFSLPLILCHDHATVVRVMRLKWWNMGMELMKLFVMTLWTGITTACSN